MVVADNVRGAGRKPLPDHKRRQRVVITLPPALIERLDMLDAKCSQVIEEALIAFLVRDTDD